MIHLHRNIKPSIFFVGPKNTPRTYTQNGAIPLLSVLIFIKQVMPEYIEALLAEDKNSPQNRKHLIENLDHDLEMLRSNRYDAITVRDIQLEKTTKNFSDRLQLQSSIINGYIQSLDILNAFVQSLDFDTDKIKRVKKHLATLTGHNSVEYSIDMDLRKLSFYAACLSSNKALGSDGIVGLDIN